MKQIAFLRGVNVGGKSKVNMKELVSLLAQEFEGVSSYIQSGNILFEGGENPQQRIEETIAKHFSVNTKVIVRTGEELRRIVELCPYPEDAAYITLLSAEAPPFERIDGKGDEYTCAGDVIYVCMNGQAHESKLQNAVFEKRTGLFATTRNMRTLKELLKRV